MMTNNTNKPAVVETVVGPASNVATREPITPAEKANADLAVAAGTDLTAKLAAEKAATPPVAPPVTGNGNKPIGAPATPVAKGPATAFAAAYAKANANNGNGKPVSGSRPGPAGKPNAKPAATPPVSANKPATVTPATPANKPSASAGKPNAKPSNGKANGKPNVPATPATAKQPGANLFQIDLALWPKGDGRIIIPPFEVAVLCVDTKVGNTSYQAGQWFALDNLPAPGPVFIDVPPASYKAGRPAYCKVTIDDTMRAITACNVTKGGLSIRSLMLSIYAMPCAAELTPKMWATRVLGVFTDSTGESQYNIVSDDNGAIVPRGLAVRIDETRGNGKTHRIEFTAKALFQSDTTSGRQSIEKAFAGSPLPLWFKTGSFARAAENGRPGAIGIAAGFNKLITARDAGKLATVTK